MNDLMPEEDVRAYIRKQRRVNRQVSVSQLRRVLSIGYKKAKRIFDDEMLSLERPVPRKRKKRTTSAATVARKRRAYTRRTRQPPPQEGEVDVNGEEKVEEKVDDAIEEPRMGSARRPARTTTTAPTVAVAVTRQRKRTRGKRQAASTRQQEEEREKEGEIVEEEGTTTTRRPPRRKAAAEQEEGKEEGEGGELQMNRGPIEERASRRTPADPENTDEDEEGVPVLMEPTMMMAVTLSPAIDASNNGVAMLRRQQPYMDTILTDEEEEEKVGELDAFTLSNCLLKAAYFAAAKHRLQKRKDADGTPYINHPLGVAWSLSEEGGIKDVETLQAAMLHECEHLHLTGSGVTVEDTDTTFEELGHEFGFKVAAIVREVTDDKSLSKIERKRQQVEHAPCLSKPAKLVKLADKLYNLRKLTLYTVRSPERIQGYFVWSDAVIRGIRGTNIGLEEKLDEVFASEFTIRGKTYPALVPENQRPAFLEKYYRGLAGVRD